MKTVKDFLLELAGRLERELTELAAVGIRSDGDYYELSVTPTRRDACRFVIHSEEESEITIEFGQLSVAHLYAARVDDLAVDASSIVEAFLAGHVQEDVGFVNGQPCRAKAVIGEGSDALSFSTRDGLCLGGETRTFKYSAYRR